MLSFSRLFRIASRPAARLKLLLVLKAFFTSFFFSMLLQRRSAITVSAAGEYPTTRTLPPSYETFHIAAVFQTDNIRDYAKLFEQAVAASDISIASDTVDRSAVLRPLVLPMIGSSNDLIIYACDAIQHQNVSVFFVVGSQGVINTVSIATRHTGIPLIGYNNDRSSAAIRVRDL